MTVKVFDVSPAANVRRTGSAAKCAPANAERDTARAYTVSAAFVPAPERVTVTVVVEPLVDCATPNVEARAEKVAPIAPVASSAASVLRKAEIFMVTPSAVFRQR